MTAISGHKFCTHVDIDAGWTETACYYRAAIQQRWVNPERNSPYWHLTY